MRMWTLSFVVVIHFFAVYNFTVGFFLTRYELPYFSRCDLMPAPEVSQETLMMHTRNAFEQAASNRRNCWTSPLYDRVVILIVDALRYDFAEFNLSASTVAPPRPATNPQPILHDIEQVDIEPLEGIGGARLSSFNNRLPIFQQTLLLEPEKSKLFRLSADPPTVTMQRLKGLTTGGLPTFIDIKNNFASTAVEEDNWVEQLRAMGRGIVQMGDDTWLSLFPKHFAHAFPFPSFNVKDLHTVDNGCIQHLLPTLRGESSPGWKDGKVKRGDIKGPEVIIAHFLGVDHVGHKYGPQHGAMSRKLRQVDEIVRAVIQEVDPPTRGGANAGNAGPSAAAPASTLLLVLGDHGMTAEGNHGGATTLETDAALFVYSTKPLFARDLGGAHAAHSHISQIDVVPTLSLVMGSAIPFGNLGHVIPGFFPGAEALLAAVQLNARQVHRYVLIYSRAANSFSQANLDHLEALFAAAEAEATAHPFDASAATLRYQRFLQAASDICRAKWTSFDLHAMATGLALLLLAILSHLLFVLVPSSTPKVSRLVVAAVLGAVGMGSSRLVLDVVPLSVGQCAAFGASLGALLLQLRALVPRRTCPAEPATDKGSAPRLGLWALWASVRRQASFPVVLYTAYALGLFSNSFIVAEHQVCVFLANSLLLYCGVQVVYPVLSRRDLCHSNKDAMLRALQLAAGMMLQRLQGWGSGVSPDSNLPKTVLEQCVLASALCLPTLGTWVWAVRLRVRLHGPLRWAFPALLVSYTLATGLVLVFWLMPPSHTSALPNALAQVVYTLSLLLLLALLLSLLVRPSLEREDGQHALWAAHWYAGAALVMVPPVMLVVGPGSATLLPMSLANFLLLHHGGPPTAPVSTSEAAVHAFFATQCLFFAVGHRNDFSSLPASVAFVGFEEFHYVLGAALMALRTFAPHLLYVLGTAASSAVQVAGRNGAAAEAGRAVAVRLAALGLCFALRGLFTAANVTLQRRHLMVWAIFAPKFAFDAVSLLVVDCLLLLALLPLAFLGRPPHLPKLD